MMTKMREMTKVLIIILSVAFVGMMVFEWGANWAGFRTARDTVAKINGEEIKIQYYQQLFQQNIENLRTQGISENLINQKAHEVTWDQLLTQKVLQQLQEEFDIEISPDEIAFFTLNVPPDVLRSNPQLYTDGRFDLEKYRTIVKNNANLFAQIYEYYKQQLPVIKVDQVLFDGIHAGLPESIDAYLETNLSADLEYLYIPRLAFRDKPSSISDEDALAYYNKNKEEFRVKEQRNIEYVSFPVNITREDSLKVEKTYKDIHKLLEQGEDFLELAEIYSDDNYSGAQKGDLGFVDYNIYVNQIPELKTAKEGDIIGPKKEVNGYKFYKVVEKKKAEKQNPGNSQKIHLYSILIAYKPSAETLEMTRQKAEEFVELANDIGFDEAANKLNLQTNESGLFQENAPVPGIGMVKSISLFTFANEEGDISRVFVRPGDKDMDTYYVIRIKEIKPEHIQDFEEVKNVCKARAEYEKRTEKMAGHTKYVRGLIEKYGSLSEAAQNDTSKISKFANLTSHRPANALKDIGQDYTFNYYAFYIAQLNNIEGPVTGSRGAFFINVLKRDSLNVQDVIPQSINRTNLILNNRRNTYMRTWLENQKKQLEVEDFRYEFYSEL
ncbi:MAG: hypothetical protein Kow00108_25990 [Calditrichia bacterium]